MTGERAVPVEVDGHVVRLTNLDKVLWPQGGYTKAHLIRYYTQIAPVLLPHLRDRPLTVTRWPDGVDGESFYQKNAPAHTPPWVRIHRVESDEKPIDYILAEDTATLVWLANQAAIELHPWLSKATQPDNPDVIVIDLDPDPPAGFAEARRVAFIVKEVLQRMQVRGYPKLSGATGVHICIPVAPRFPYSVASRFAGFIGRIVADLVPTLATVERRVKQRQGRVYVDHLQNLPGKTIVAAYSVRPRERPTVSMPVTWTELEDCEPEDFTIDTVPEHVARHGDRAAAVLQDRQDITAWAEELRIGPAARL
ncbi:MAG TPA: non-homologous end-joining DNA ligase [Limnochordales bacterium]